MSFLSPSENMLLKTSMYSPSKVELDGSILSKNQKKSKFWQNLRKRKFRMNSKTPKCIIRENKMKEISNKESLVTFNNFLDFK